MHNRSVLVTSVIFTMSVLLGACTTEDGSLVHHLEVVVGADVRTIEAGQLNASLYAYDPRIADKAPDTLDTQRVPFEHTQGTATTTAVTLTGRVPEGFETFVGVEGYEREGDVLNRVLWDGQEGIGMPTRIEMKVLTDENLPEAARLAESLSDWQVLKGQNGGDYQYDVYSASWVGFSSTTTFEVRDDEVVLRRYEGRDAEGEVTESWTEEGNTLGLHEGYEPLRTIEELYAVCRNEVLTQDRTQNDIFLEFRDDGVLEYCQYFPKTCADDCLVGVSISDIRFLGEPEVSALTTDRSEYVATCTNDSVLRCTFTLEATYHNRTDRPVYLYRCFPDSPQPNHYVSPTGSYEDAGYGYGLACTGHRVHFKVAPGGTRVDVLELYGPITYDGVTWEPLGALEGTLKLGYDVRGCADEVKCGTLPDESVSAPFTVRLTGSDARDEGLEAGLIGAR